MGHPDKFRLPEPDGKLIQPEKTLSQKIRSFFSSPQAHQGIIVGSCTLLSILVTCVLWYLNTRSTPKENSALKREIHTLQQQKGDLEHQVSRLTTENEGLKTRDAFYVSLPLLFPTIISNLSDFISTQPTNQQQLLSLLISLQARTNGFSEASSRPAFTLSISGQKLTDCSLITLTNSRTVDIVVENTSPVVAEQLTIVFTPVIVPLDPTNILVTTGWHLQPIKTRVGVIFRGSEQKVNSWRWRAANLLPMNDTYYVDPLEISTNWLYEALGVQLRVYDAKSKVQSYLFGLRFLSTSQ